MSKIRISVDKYERNTVLSVRKAVRADSGKYKLVLTNSSGTCEGVADVVVLGESPTTRRLDEPMKVKAKF